VALRGSACSWLMNLPPGSICSWDDLCHQFVANFQGTFMHPSLECDLHDMKQQEGETLRCFIQRFSQVRNTIPRKPSRCRCRSVCPVEPSSEARHVFENHRETFRWRRRQQGERWLGTPAPGHNWSFRPAVRKRKEKEVRVALRANQYSARGRQMATPRRWRCKHYRAHDGPAEPP
jgi:hypothetical protein